MFDQITLTRYRNYIDRRFMLDPQARFTFVSGDNGAGKTNLLEAISLLSTARGLRSDSLQNIGHQQSNSWSVTVNFDEHTFSTGLKPEQSKRFLIINSEEIKSMSTLDEWLGVVWLTPQMDGLFGGYSGERRQFFDRLIQVFDPPHRGRLVRYEKALRERNKLIKEGEQNDAWFKSLEQTLVETGMALAATRMSFIVRLNTILETQSTHFIAPQLQIHCAITDRLTIESAAAAEQYFFDELQRLRPSDQHTGYTTIGIHKSDIQAVHPQKNVTGDLCSTGEQKAFLIATILGHARLLKQTRDIPLIILLDDVMSHLDENRRQDLLSDLSEIDTYCWISGTELSSYLNVHPQTQHIEI